ncbi:nuclear transport factor 2 family protein [Massilia endophytica]|uniref:nuclear transport factor 2 family protein n=1 Tax=Massilia endophytica TaxID=2899220 RepID=UPI001E5D56B7|nr:nuclear transport factor 2 family protein [Massilia endophytica]UGQ48612.1 nuclear transport factor 2 family protein [Massilia endophytica]
MLLLLLSAQLCAAQPSVSDADAVAIRETALNYVEGWYDGDAGRMAKALHPQLVKRIAVHKNGKSYLQETNAQALVEMTGKGYGKNVPEDQRQKEVVILDVFGNAASVRATMKDWIDYMQMAKVDGRWVIVNVLWEQKPPK